MRVKGKNITVFEHQSLRLNDVIDGQKFNNQLLSSLQQHFGVTGVPYYSLINNGVKFNEYVGVIQVGDTLIEILPKADKDAERTDSKSRWRDILLHMLKTVDFFEIQAPSSGSLDFKPNSVLDLYFELFVREVEYLLHIGLVKKYIRVEGNVLALKGRMQFSDHISKNLTHAERFYVNHQTYSIDHTLHRILYKTLLLLQHVNTNSQLSGRIGAALLHFPTLPDIKVSEQTFDDIIYSRKTSGYKSSIAIARLLLLKFHPDLRSGRNDLLAIMFDMNLLWERFVYTSLRRNLDRSYRISAQSTKHFWKPVIGSYSDMRPDVVITDSNQNTIVIDTKWKNLNGVNPSTEDLRQMFVYHQYFKARKVALVYPGQSINCCTGFYTDIITGAHSDKECSVITILLDSVPITISKQIFRQLQEGLGFDTKTTLHV